MAIAPRRRSPRRPWGALTLLAILIAGLGWILYLRLTDQPMRDPFGFYSPTFTPEAVREEVELKQFEEEPSEGMVHVLLAARGVKAYSQVLRDDLFDPRTLRLSFRELPKSFVEANGVLVRPDEIVGRVMARPKRIGFPFTEKDFLPVGTRPGLTAGVPPGKRALRVDVNLVHGIIGLSDGDRFDLLASRAVTPPAPLIPHSALARSSTGSTVGLGAYSDLLPRAGDSKPGAAPGLATAQTQAKVEVIVQGGVVVSALETRLVPTTAASLTAGQISGTRPVQEMVIALDADEVAPLMAALSVKADVHCVARSSRAGEDPDSLTPGFLPAFLNAANEEPSARLVEQIVGGVRTLVAVPMHQSASGKRSQ